jgi:autotransporter-associated beta strand protein
MADCPHVWLMALLVFMSFIPHGVRAAAIQGEASDTDVRSDGTLSPTGNTTLVAAASGSPVFDRSSVLVFKLPNFGAVANPFTSSSLRFNLSSKTGTPPNIDLYGLGRRVSSTVLASDYYGATSTADPTDATLIQSNILISTTANGPVYTSSTGATALKNYLNTQYASGAGAGQFVFIRLSSDAASTTAKSYTITPANAANNGPRIIYNIPSGFTRPFIWVRDSEKAGILAKISGNPWATSVYNGMVSRVAADLASHQSNRDTFLRGLPIVDWAAATPKFKTIPTYAESTVRFPAEQKFNDALDCAVLYYLTGDANYARCAGDILHNSVKTLLPVTASTSTGNGGWIFQSDLLKEARVTGNQLPIVYDFLYTWLQTNQVYDVKTASMVNFNFTNAQSFFRKYYQLTRDHGQKESNWSALMATTMLNNLLALDDSTERNTALQIYLTTGTSRQASLDYDYRHYTQAGDIWPESLQYAGAVGSIRSLHMVLLERVDPALNLFDKYPNLPLSLPRISYLRYPNGEQVMFGDGHRAGSNGPFFHYEQVYQHALARGRTDITSFFGSLINGGVADGNYNRSTLDSYSTLGTQTEPLQLLLQAATLAEPAVTPTLPRSDTLPFAGISLQRNPAPTNNTNYGLMCFVGGAAHVHSHASGMSMELYGMGEVMGAKSGTEDYGTAINENFYRVFASNNTVIVNGASRGEGGWGDYGINTVQNVAMEPQPFASAVSPDFSFTCSSFADDKGTQAEGTQQRTVSIVRTSPISGYYVDFFRSKSTVTNRTATTLNGAVTNQYHDYIYRNIGDTAVDLRADGVTLPLLAQANRFQNDIGDANEQPGWRYFTNTVVSYPTSSSVKAQFVATVSGTPRYMDMHMPAVASREYAKVDSPEILEAPSPYNTRVAPTLVVRQIGEAWNKAFATVYEPHFGSTGGTVQNVTQLVRSGVVVGVKVESSVGGKNLVQYVISNPASTETYSDSSIGLSFTGRFGIASSNGDGTTTLYLGQGSAISYKGNSLSTVSGSNSQAQARFTPGLAPVVTANTTVNAISAPPPPNSTWVPAAAGTYNWNNTANWNPATIPNSTGYLANKNINLTGNQTVNLNIPVTLGELAVGDSNGAETTTLQKGSSGSLVFDQTENETAYLTRTANGTGNVTFASDLNISLTDNLSVRLGGGSASSSMLIAGVISGAGKTLTKDGNGLTLSLSGANTYSGETHISGGILSLDNPLAIQNSTLDTLNSVTGTATDGLRTTATSLTLGGLSGNKDLASIFTTTSGGYTALTALTLNPGASSSADYPGVIANGAAGMALTKTGTGTQTLSGPNTYTGGTSLSTNSGTLEIGGTGTLGGGSYAGAIAIGSGSIFRYSSSAAQTLSGSISGSGSLNKVTSTSTLTLSGANTSFTGPVTVSSGSLTLGNTNALSAASALTLSGTSALKTSVQNATVNAPITISGTPSIHAPDFGSGSTTSTLTLAGAINGSANVTFSSLSTVASNSNQTIRLNAQSTYSGGTTLNPADSDTNLAVKLGITNALPPTTVLSINGVSGGGSGREADFDLNGFSQTLAGLQNVSASLRSQRVLNGPGTAAVLTFNNTAAHVFTGTISGTNLSIVKYGAGTQTLGGSNSYNGTTTVNAGKLRGIVGGNCANSSFTLANSSATLGVSITDNTKIWTCAALTTTAAGTLEFDFSTVTPGSVKPLTVTGLAAFSTTPAVRVVVTNPLAPGTYPLMTWGSTSGTAPTMVSVVNSAGVGNLGDGATASLNVSANTLNLVIVGAPLSVKANNTNNLNLGTSWTGSAIPNATATAIWNSTVSAANTTVLGANATWAGISISNPGGAVTINAGHTLTLGANENDINMSAATANLTLNCPLVLGDANTWNVGTGRTLTLGGVVSGAFPVTKAGAGTALLNAVNTYTGDTAVAANSGTLEIGGTGSLGAGTYAGAIDIGSASVFRYNSSATQALNGPVSGTGTLNKSSSSTLTLGAANSGFTGAIAINAGTLKLGNTAALGTASSLTIVGGATLSSEITGISTSVPITLGTAGTTSIIAFGRNTSASGSITYNGPISGAGNLTLTTTSSNSGNNLQTLFLGSANTYAGNTLITTANSGNTFTVKATSIDVLPATTVLTLNGGNGLGSGRTVTFDLNGYDQTISGLTNTISTLTARNQRINNSSAETATFTINNTADLIYGGTGISSTFNGNTINPTAQIIGNLELVKTGSGKFTLAPGAGNSFTGSTTVVEGIFSIGHPTSLQNSPLDTFSSTTGDASNGLQTTVTTLTLGGLIGDKNLASLFTTTSGGYTGITALTLNPGSGAIRDYSGIIANGAAGMTLTKSGTGTQILSGSNTYTGATAINAGTLALGANDVLPPSALSIGGATLDASTFTDTLGTLDVTGAAKINIGTGAALAFAASNGIDWAGGTLDITGAFVSGASLRFGTSNSGLTTTQLSLISASGFSNFGLNTNGYLTANSDNSYLSWASSNAGSQSAELDFDNDGVQNGIEYLLGGTSTTNDSSKLPVMTTVGENMVFTFIREQSSIDPTTSVTIEVGENLAVWSQSFAVPATTASNNPGVSVVKDSPVAGKDTVTLTLPLDSGGRGFARLKVVP